MSTIKQPPAGYRYLLAHEAERLVHGSSITLFDGDLRHATVRSFGDATMTVHLANGEAVTLDLDDPDYWGDNEVRERRPPMTPDGEIVALCEVMATADEDVEPLLRTGVALALAAKNDPELQEAIAALRRIVTNRLQGRAA